MMAQAAGLDRKDLSEASLGRAGRLRQGTARQQSDRQRALQIRALGKGRARRARGQPGLLPRQAEVDRLIFRRITDANVARAEFDSDQLPLSALRLRAALAEVPALQRDKTIDVVFTPSHYSRDIQLNLRKPPLDNLKVREAIATAIDRDNISKLGFNGFWKPAVHANVDTQVQWINRDVRFPAFDKAKAEKLLDEAGYPKGRRLALRGRDDRAVLFGLQEHQRSAGAATAAGRHQRQARAVRSGDLVPRACRRAISTSAATSPVMDPIRTPIANISEPAGSATSWATAIPSSTPSARKR